MQKNQTQQAPQLLRAEEIIHKVKLFNEVHSLQDKRFINDAIRAARYEKYISLCREMAEANDELREFNQTIVSLKTLGVPFTINNGQFYV